MGERRQQSKGIQVLEKRRFAGSIPASSIEPDSLTGKTADFESVKSRLQTGDMQVRLLLWLLITSGVMASTLRRGGRLKIFRSELGEVRSIRTGLTFHDAPHPARF